MLFSIPTIIANPHFSLIVRHHEKKTILCMQVMSGITHTSSLPFTTQLLLERLPSIFKTQCFNDKDFSFFEEVKNTEIGHLFEHILLENLYMAKEDAGYKNITIKGETYWNWYKDPSGMFHISINIGKNDVPIFNDVLPCSVALLSDIMEKAVIKKGAKTIVLGTKDPYPLTKIA